jgi:pimeloyl-ACP methyl ester carboxylesterase
MVPQLRRDFRLVTYDLRGHGYSPVTPEGYTTEQMACDLLHVLDGLGIERAHLVGHSFGADVCLHFALLHPDRVDRIVAIEPGLAALIDQRKSKEWAGWAYWASRLEEAGVDVPQDRRTDLDYLLEASLEAPKFFGPARGLPRNRGALIRLIRETSLLRDYEEPGSLTREAVATIRTPTLLVYGEHSHFLGSLEFLQATLPDSRTSILSAGEHFGPLEQPDELVAHVREFLGTSPAPPRPRQSTPRTEQPRP